MKHTIPTESQEQATVIQWCLLRADAKHILAIPNGANKSPAARAKFKREGLRAGVPDLFLPVPIPPYHGMFIEMKRKKGGVVSQEQAEWMDILLTNGYEVVICRGADEAILAIRQYLEGRR